MAAGGNGDLKTAFGKFCPKGKDGFTSKDMTKWCKDGAVFGKSCSSNNLDIAFAKCKKGPLLKWDQMDALVTELAKTYKVDKKLADNDIAKVELTKKLAGASPAMHGTTKGSSDAATARLTDTSKYTGAHKERFDEDGKGKGKQGREDIVSGDGYVSGYKEKDTYDSKQK